MESIAGQLDLPHVAQVSKKLKLSHFHSIAAGKQPSKLMSLPSVPEFSHIVVVSNLPGDLQFSFTDGSLQQCAMLQQGHDHFLVPCGGKLLRKIDKTGGEIRLFGYSVQGTPALHNLGDVENFGTSAEKVPLACNRHDCPCQRALLVLEQQQTSASCADWVFGVRWSPEKFLDKAIQVGHPFGVFSGLSPEVKHACEKLAQSRYEDVVNLRCQRLGEWLKLAKSLQGEELAIKAIGCQSAGVIFWKRNALP